MCEINYQNWNSLWHKLGCSYSGKRCHGFWFNILLTKTVVHMILLHMKPFLYSISLSMIGFGFFRLKLFTPKLYFPFLRCVILSQTPVKLSVFYSAAVTFLQVLSLYYQYFSHFFLSNVLVHFLSKWSIVDIICPCFS